jgi:hypothetical protein
MLQRIFKNSKGRGEGGEGGRKEGEYILQVTKSLIRTWLFVCLFVCGNDISQNMVPFGIIGRPLVSRGAQDGFIMFRLMV